MGVTLVPSFFSVYIRFSWFPAGWEGEQNPGDWKGAYYQHNMGLV